ncbi:MAG TPA: hypothetical protein VMS65_00525 [Polyangiaceae bacterium]|nr:hypothetical protein [Polyangiaceae bacterium]
MPPALGSIVASFALVFVPAGCRSEGSGKTNLAASATASAAPVAPPARVPPPEKEQVTLCRVIALRPAAGTRADAGSETNAPAVGTTLEGREWLELTGKTEIALRHSATTRELVLRGPGRFLPCFLGAETVLVARGGVQTTAGAGARAGAEVILATPFGTLHFADAALELRVGERDAEANVATGIATWVHAAARTPDGGSPDVVLGPRSRKKFAGPVVTADLVSHCREASEPIGAEPPRLSAGEPNARARLGEWSVAQLRARQTARWACAAARAAAGRENATERTRWWTELSKTDRVWQ